MMECCEGGFKGSRLVKGGGLGMIAGWQLTSVFLLDC